MRAVIGVFIALCGLLWATGAQAQDMRFQVELSFEDAGVAPSISEQVQQALPQLWQRIVPQRAQSQLRDVSAMALLKSIHPHGLSSTVVFNEQRVWQTLQARGVPYISPQPRFYITLDVLDTLGRHDTAMEVELRNDVLELCQTWGIEYNPHAPLLALHVQWLNDVQFYISAVQKNHDTQRDQNHWQQGELVMAQLKASLQKMLLNVRNQSLVQTVVDASVDEEQPIVETQRFMLDIEKQTSLAQQILLETALTSDARVVSMTPTLIESTHQVYQVVVKQAPELWLEEWFAQRGMVATLGLEAWLVQ